MLTPKQKELLLYLDWFIKNNGYAPTYQEMMDALNASSRSGVHGRIVELERRRFIRRMPNRARAIEVIKLPVDQANVVPKNPISNCHSTLLLEEILSNPDVVSVMTPSLKQRAVKHLRQIKLMGAV